MMMRMVSALAILSVWAMTAIYDVRQLKMRPPTVESSCLQHSRFRLGFTCGVCHFNVVHHRGTCLTLMGPTASLGARWLP